MSQFNWIPSLDAVAEDAKDLEDHIAKRRRVLAEDHHECGCLYSTWITDAHYCEQIRHGIQTWIDDRKGLTSYEAWGREVLVSFASKNNAMMFKLMYGGA